MSIYFVLYPFKSPKRNCWSRWCQKMDVLQLWRKKIFRKLSTIRIYEVKYLWGIAKQIQHGLFWEVVKLLVPRCWIREVRLLPSVSRREVVSHIQHLETSNFYYFSQYHVVFVYYMMGKKITEGITMNPVTEAHWAVCCLVQYPCRHLRKFSESHDSVKFCH